MEFQRMGGNKHTGARSNSLRKSGAYRSAGRSLAVVSAGISAVQGVQAARQGNYAGAAKSTLDIGMTYVGVAGGPIGAGVSVGYFAVDTFIGWDKVVNFFRKNNDVIGRQVRESNGQCYIFPMH